MIQPSQDCRLEVRFAVSASPGKNACGRKLLRGENGAPVQRLLATPTLNTEELSFLVPDLQCSAQPFAPFSLFPSVGFAGSVDVGSRGRSSEREDPRVRVAASGPAASGPEAHAAGRGRGEADAALAPVQGGVVLAQQVLPKGLATSSTTGARVLGSPPSSAHRKTEKTNKLDWSQHLTEQPAPDPLQKHQKDTLVGEARDWVQKSPRFKVTAQIAQETSR